MVTLPTAWFIIAFSCPLAAQRPDTIFPADGSRNIRGKIIKVTPNGVVAKVQNSDKSIPAVEIRSIAFGDEPISLRQARDAMEDGQLEQAEQALERVKVDEIEREAVKQEYAYVRAVLTTKQAAEGRADVAEASRQMLKFLKNNKTSYHFYTAVKTLGDLTMQSGDYDKAARYYSTLGRSPWPVTKLMGSVLEGDALRSQGKSKYSEAMKKYDRVLAAKSDTPELRRLQLLATVGRSTCQAELGQVDTAIAALQKIIQENDAQDVELFARTYNALGGCYRVSGKKMDAILEYLKVDQLFFRESSAHAESLYWLSKLMAEIGHPARANRAKTLLGSRYGTTVWARR